MLETIQTCEILEVSRISCGFVVVNAEDSLDRKYHGLIQTIRREEYIVLEELFARFAPWAHLRCFAVE